MESESKETQPQPLPPELHELTRRVEALERAVRQLTEELRQLYENPDVS